jgi:hypothetical protein
MRRGYESLNHLQPMGRAEANCHQNPPTATGEMGCIIRRLRGRRDQPDSFYVDNNDRTRPKMGATGTPHPAQERNCVRHYYTSIHEFNSLQFRSTSVPDCKDQSRMVAHIDKRNYAIAHWKPTVSIFVKRRSDMFSCILSHSACVLSDPSPLIYVSRVAVSNSGPLRGPATLSKK